MQLQTFTIICYFDPVTDICVGAMTPDKEQWWLAGSSKAGSNLVSGQYDLPLVVQSACAACDTTYQWCTVCPLGKTAQELQEFAKKGNTR